jgi:hypothetical protein
MIALCATGGPSETEVQAKIVANLKSDSEDKRCPLTGKKTFAAALAAILTTEELAGRVMWFEIDRGSNPFPPRGTKYGAAIVYRPETPSEHSKTSWFGVPNAGRGIGLGSRVTLTLPFHILVRIIKEDGPEK